MKLISASSQVQWGIKLLQTHSRVLQRSLSINSSKEKDVLNVTGDCMVEFKCTNQFYIHVGRYMLRYSQMITLNFPWRQKVSYKPIRMYSSKKIPLQKRGTGILLELSAKVSENTIISIFVGNKQIMNLRKIIFIFVVDHQL